MELIILYVSAGLMALVGVVCTVLCIAWSIPSWRRRLASPQLPGLLKKGKLAGLSGHLSIAMVSIGIAVCAVAGWYGCFSLLAALG